jgi:hypothetical protein
MMCMENINNVIWLFYLAWILNKIPGFKQNYYACYGIPWIDCAVVYSRYRVLVPVLHVDCFCIVCFYLIRNSSRFCIHIAVRKEGIAYFGDNNNTTFEMLKYHWLNTGTRPVSERLSWRCKSFHQSRAWFLHFAKIQRHWEE